MTIRDKDSKHAELCFGAKGSPIPIVLFKVIDTDDGKKSRFELVDAA